LTKKALKPAVAVKHPDPVDAAELAIAKQCVEALKQLIGKEAGKA
jgi:hypothetical protein